MPGVRLISSEEFRQRIFDNYGLRPGDRIPAELRRLDGLTPNELQQMLDGAVLRSAEGEKLYGINVDIDISIENGLPVGAAIEPSFHYTPRFPLTGTTYLRFYDTSSSD